MEEMDDELFIGGIEPEPGREDEVVGMSSIHGRWRMEEKNDDIYKEEGDVRVKLSNQFDH